MGRDFGLSLLLLSMESPIWPLNPPHDEWSSKPDINKSFVSYDVYETRHAEANLSFQAKVLERCGLGPIVPLIKTMIRHSLTNCFCPYDLKLFNGGTDFMLQICLYNEKGFHQLNRFWFLVSEKLPYQVTLTYEPHRVDMYFVLLAAQHIPLDKQVSYPEVCERIGKIIEEFSKD